MRKKIKRVLQGLIFALLLGCGVCQATSYIAPAFAEPLVFDDVILVHHNYGRKLICLDKKTGSLRWQAITPEAISAIHRYDAGKILVLHFDKLSVVSMAQGKILMTQDVPGQPFACSTDSKLFSYAKDESAICHDLETGKLKWYRVCKTAGSFISPFLARDFVFIPTTPTTISMQSDGKSEKTTMSGNYSLTCLSALDGNILWRESLPLNSHGFTGEAQVSVGPLWLLCVTENAIRLLDRKTGQPLNRWHSKEDVDGADFWGTERLAICIGGIGAYTRKIGIMNIPRFTVESVFTVEAAEVAAVKVVGDVMILSSLYRNIGVSLSSKKVIWQKWQRHFTVHDGLLYFGEYIDDKRVLGVCDPNTGRDTLLYSEKVN